MKIKKQFILVLISIFFISSCDNSKKAFQETENKATKEAYVKFIHDHPKSSFIEIANHRIIEIDHWEKTKESKTTDLYREYIKSFPKGLFVSDAEKKIQMIIDYEKVKSSDIVKSYISYLDKYPTSFFSERIEKRISELQYADKEFKLLEKGIDTEVLKNYLTKFHDTGYAKLIKERLNNRSIEKYNVLLPENNAKILRLYLKEFEGTEGFKLMRTRLDKMALEEFQTIQDETDIEILKKFILKFPDTKQANIIQSRIFKLFLPQIENKVFSKKEYKLLPTSYDSLIEYINKNYNKNDIKVAKQAREDILIELIEQVGISNRFLLNNIYIFSNPSKTTYRFSFKRSDTEEIMFSDYPNDRIPVEMEIQMMGKMIFETTGKMSKNIFQDLHFSHGYVWRFYGKNKLKQYIINGNLSEPLCFYLIQNVGPVYLCGKGSIIKDGKTIFSEQATHGILTVRSNVNKDKVYINNKEYGSTRLDISLPFCQHVLRVEKSGYIPYKKSIDFKESTTIKVKLEKKIRSLPK